MFNLESPPDEKQMIKKVIAGEFSFESQAAFARHLVVSPTLITKLKKKLTYKEIYETYYKTKLFFLKATLLFNIFHWKQ